MNAAIRVAQATGNPSVPALIKISKPQTNQALTIHLDGATKIDLTAIGAERGRRFKEEVQRLRVMADG